MPQTPLTSTLLIDGIEIALTRKDIRTLRLSIRPPEGLVRLSAPRGMSEAAIRRALESKLDWIRKHRERFAKASPARPARYMDGEEHYFLGLPRRLRVSERAARPLVKLEDAATIRMQVRPGSTEADRAALLERWYRRALADLLPPLLAAWEARLGVKAAAWGIRRMTSRWGSCNIGARRVWFNLELAKRPPECLEYVVVHELAHLLERGHGPRFKAIMSERLPRWRELKALLASAPEDWIAWVRRGSA